MAQQLKGCGMYCHSVSAVAANAEVICNTQQARSGVEAVKAHGRLAHVHNVTKPCSWLP